MPDLDSPSLSGALPSPDVLTRMVARLGEQQRIEYLEGITKRVAVYEHDRSDEALAELVSYFDSWAMSLTLLSSPAFQAQATTAERKIVQGEIGDEVTANDLDHLLQTG